MFQLLSFDLCYVNKQVGPFAVSRHCQTVSGCTAVSYLFTYLLPDGYPISYPVGYSGNELPDNGIHTANDKHNSLHSLDNYSQVYTMRPYKLLNDAEFTNW